MHNSTQTQTAPTIEIITVHIRGTYDAGLYEVPATHVNALATLNEYPEHPVVLKQLTALLEAPEGEYGGVYSVVSSTLASWANAILASRWDETPWRMSPKPARELLAGMKHQAEQIKGVGGTRFAGLLQGVACVFAAAASVPPAKEAELFKQGITAHELATLYALLVGTNLETEMERLKLTAYKPAEPRPMELLNAAKKVVMQGVAHTLTLRKQRTNNGTH